MTSYFCNVAHNKLRRCWNRAATLYAMLHRVSLPSNARLFCTKVFNYSYLELLIYWSLKHRINYYRNLGNCRWIHACSKVTCKQGSDGENCLSTVISIEIIEYNIGLLPATVGYSSILHLSRQYRPIHWNGNNGGWIFTHNPLQTLISITALYVHVAINELHNWCF